MLKFILILRLILLFGPVSCSSTPRIVNGTAVSTEKYPFVASLIVASRFHICGCTIIATNWVLAPAHCLKINTVELISVQYATSEETAPGKNVVGVKRIIVHDKYDHEKGRTNDIALLELASSIEFDNKTIAAVTLPKKDFEIPQTEKGAPGVILGWGRLKINGTIQRHLQELPLKIYSDKECNKIHNGTTTKDHICGGIEKVDKDACYGGSGGPLFYEGSIQLGIASWIKKNDSCAATQYPAVFTKVSHYIDWINKHIS